MVRDARVELGKQVVGGVGGKRRREARPLQRNRGVEGTDTAVADLRRGRKTETRF